MSLNYKTEKYAEEKERRVFVNSTCDCCKIVVTENVDERSMHMGRLQIAVGPGSDNYLTAWLCEKCLEEMTEELRSRMEMTW